MLVNCVLCVFYPTHRKKLVCVGRFVWSMAVNVKSLHCTKIPKDR